MTEQIKKPKRRRDVYQPYRILVYLLYGLQSAPEWLESISGTKVRISTGPASRAFRIKISEFWELLYWLEDNKLVDGVRKGRKHGSALITLKQPTTFTKEQASGEADDTEN